jgi:hypothetical protein
MDNVESRDLFYHLTTEAIEMRRIFIGRRVWQATGGVVQHGLLAGYYLGDRATWRHQDNAAKLLGLYEQEVCELIGRIKADRSTFVDLGAADGFYAVGLVATRHFERSYCYEIDDASRENLREMANRADVGANVHLFGAATASFPAELVAHGVRFSDSVVLCDIEGHEFEVLTRECLEQLKDAQVIVELHDFQIANGHGPRLYRELLERAGEFFNIREYRTGVRDLSKVPLFDDHWTDTDRWLACSEGRAKLMTWLHLEPKQGVAQ